MGLRIMLIVLGLFASVFAAGASDRENNGCIFNVTNSETEKNLPVPLYNISSDYDLAVPHQGSIYLKPGQNISLSCSGTRNYVRQTNSNVTTVKCIEHDEVELYRNVWRFEEIKCKNFVTGDIRPTKEKCANGEGRVYQIGYPVSRKDWITLISVCYVPDIGTTLYTKHVIFGKEIKYASKTKYRPKFSTAGQLANITASQWYLQDQQKTTFSSILGSSELASQYINNNSFLAKGHLAPHADFLLATAQFSTYFYINAAPQWQSINGASWKSVEFTVRELATHYGNLVVLTGTYSILTYNDTGNNPRDMFLGQNNTLPVPKYFWKTVYEPMTGKAITFVILNDPYVKAPQKHVFCNDICESSGFRKSSWKDPSSGYVFCCTFNDFRNNVKTTPKLRVFGILTNPALDVPLKRLRLNDI